MIRENGTLKKRERREQKLGTLCEMQNGKKRVSMGFANDTHSTAGVHWGLKGAWKIAFQPLHETASESNSEGRVEVFADDLFHLALQSICLEETMEPKPFNFSFVCLR